MPNHEKPADRDKLSQEELQLLIQQKTLEALQDIKDLIEQHEPEAALRGDEMLEEVPDFEHKLYLRWKSGEEEEE